MCRYSCKWWNETNGQVRNMFTIILQICLAPWGRRYDTVVNGGLKIVLDSWKVRFEQVDPKYVDSSVGGVARGIIDRINYYLSDIFL